MRSKARSLSRADGWVLATCIAVPLVIGQAAPAIVFALDPSAVTGISPSEVGVPVWWFILVFTIIYSGMGVACWTILRRGSTREGAPKALLLTAIGVGFVQSLLFWFARGLPAILVADLNSVLVSVAVTALVFHFARQAAWWLLPWPLWMITTTVLKVFVIASSS